MLSCEKIHREYDRYASSQVQVGQLPEWMHVNGKVAWYVCQGPYTKLPEAWADFMKKIHALKEGKVAGPPGEVFVCNPEEHQGTEEKLITILWVPLK